jgi:hypothetical protein
MICAALALIGGVVGPQSRGPRNRAAGAPFEYHPPDGFVARPPKDADASVSHVWVYEEEGDGRPVATDQGASLIHAVLHHSSKEMSVEERDLAKLAHEMPRAFEDSCTWTHRRHELRTRSDGARVGLIEGDCRHDVDLGALGLQTKKVHARKLQLMFPDDSGTSIVTASYPADQAARWEPVFEATIAKASGVATRVPSPAAWIYAVWAAAGAVLGWLASALVARRASTTALPSEHAR